MSKPAHNAHSKKFATNLQIFVYLTRVSILK